MIDWDKPIETTDGYPARVISTDLRDDMLTLVVVQAELENMSLILRFLKDGTRMYHGTNIRNVKVKREGWVNVMAPTSYSYHQCRIFPTKEAAMDYKNEHTVATIKIEWEE